MGFYGRGGGMGAHCVRRRRAGAPPGAAAAARVRAWCRSSPVVVAAGPCSRQGGPAQRGLLIGWGHMALKAPLRFCRG